ncbi:MAG: hypothetical protein O7F73_20285 [Gammaproteobacteria bacterium]|nr:hypothetical protein [Gammaproteobacteria bacterium]
MKLTKIRLTRRGKMGFGLLLLLAMQQLRAESATDTGEIQASDFKCMLDMQAVRGFYVDNLDPDKRSDTAAVAERETGVYPVGSVVQLVPTEVMVKHPRGFNAATRDWEFFELTVSEAGTRIDKRGFVDVVNRFGGNCFGCHVKARPEFDMICETGHGCDPIPITPQMTQLLQKMDPRCAGPRYQPTQEELQLLKQLGG